jgi:hypothetical protein
MDSFLEKPKTGNNKVLLGALVVAVLVVAAVAAFLVFRPSKQQVVEQQLQGAVREGTPEFEVLTKKIAIQTDDERTMESPTGMGTITMFIAGKIRNFTGKTLTGLEIKVTVIDQLNKPVKEKILTVIPAQQERLETNQTMSVSVMMEGFSKDDDRALVRWKVTAIKTQD